MKDEKAAKWEGYLLYLFYESAVEEIPPEYLNDKRCLRSTYEPL